MVCGLTERGVPVVRLDLSWFPQRLTLDAEFRDGAWRGCLLTVPRTLVTNDPTAVSRFAVAIHAGSESSYVDWRSDYPALSYEVVELPAAVVGVAWCGCWPGGVVDGGYCAGIDLAGAGSTPGR